MTCLLYGSAFAVSVIALVVYAVVAVAMFRASDTRVEKWQSLAYFGGFAALLAYLCYRLALSA